MNTSLNKTFEGFEYNKVWLYVNKIARSLPGLMSDKTLEYNDIVSYGMLAAIEAFRKWDIAYNNDRSDVAHLEAYVKTCIAGNMKNVGVRAKQRNTLQEDGDDSSEDIVDIDGISQLKYAKLFYSKDTNPRFDMIDISSYRFYNDDKDSRIESIDDFTNSLKGIDLDIMNIILKRDKRTLKELAISNGVSNSFICNKKRYLLNELKKYIISHK